MNKTRTLPILTIFLVWLSLTGFRPLSQPTAGPSQNPALSVSLTDRAALPAAPEPFSKQLPVNGAINQPSNNVVLQWGASSPNVRYQYCLRTNKALCPKPKWVNVGTSTKITLHSLSPNTRYYWQVRAVDAANETTEADGGWWQFTTVQNANLPGPFTKLTPADAETGQPVDGVSLSWTASSLATSYQYCYDAVNNNTCDTFWRNSTALSATVSGLAHGAIYYWQVRAVNASGNVEGDFGTWFSFQTQLAPPGVFNKTSPENLATGQPLDLTLTWGASAGTGIAYEYCIDTSPCTPNSTWMPAGANLYAEPSGLAYETTYYWQVRASNTTDTFYADGGSSWSFTTSIAPPQNFNKTSPANNLNDQPLSLVLSWGTSAGSNVHYEYCFSTTTCTPASTWQQAGTNKTASVSGLAYATTYYWQVRAVNTTGATYADGGSGWKFTTRGPAPQAFSKLSPADASPDKVAPNLTLRWSPSAFASEYYYCVDTASHAVQDTSCSTDWHLTTATETFNLDLNYKQTYYWQVYAKNSQGTLLANNGVWWSFTTVDEAPKDFSKISPVDGALDQPLTPWLYWWTPATPGNTYEFCVRTGPNCLGGIWRSIGENAPIHITTTLPLAPGTTYSWQVRASNSGGTTYANNNTWWTFTTLKAPPTSGNQAFSMDENTTLTQTLAATSNYGKEFSLYGSQPAGTLDFNSDGSFTYTPEPYFNGTITFQFVVSDGYNPPSLPFTVTITVNAVNNPPVLSPIPDQVTGKGKLVSFWAQASDPDMPYGEYLIYSIDEALPAGAHLNEETGFFSWQVPANQAPGVYTFTVRVTDSGGLASTQTVKITVGIPKIYMPLLVK